MAGADRVAHARPEQQQPDYVRAASAKHPSIHWSRSANLWILPEPVSWGSGGPTVVPSSGAVSVASLLVNAGEHSVWP